MNLTIDGNPPTVSITSPSAGYINNSRAIRINATVIDASLNYTLIEIRNITGAVLNSTANSSSNFSIVLTSPVDAVNLTINLTAYDLAGNKKSATVIVSVDTTNPSLVINSASGRMLTSTTVLYNFTTIDTNLNYCGWYRDDVLFTLSSPGEIQSGVDFANPYVGHSQGYHNWSVRCVDLAGNSNTSTVQNFTVDSVVPTVTSMSPADGAYKNTRNVTVFFTPTDTNLQNCTVFANGTIYGAYNSTNGLATGSAFNVTLLNRGVGYQNWSVICYDIMSSANSGITYSFTVDITAPAVPNTTISASSTSATLYYTSNESVNATVVSGTTVLGSTSSYANSSSVSLSGLSASTTYYYNITVCDQAGNCATNTSSSNFTTSAASSDDDGSTSGGSGSTYTTSSQIADGITKVFYPGEALTFTAAGATHSFLLVSIAYDLTTATIQLASAPQKATLTVGEEKKFDLDANGYYDVYVKLNNITTKMKADFTVRTINESMTAAPIVPAKNETDAAPSTVKEKVEEKVEQVTEAAKGGKGAWIFWTITVVVILLLGWWVVVSMRKGKKR